MATGAVTNTTRPALAEPQHQQQQHQRVIPPPPQEVPPPRKPGAQGKQRKTVPAAGNNQPSDDTAKCQFCLGQTGRRPELHLLERCRSVTMVPTSERIGRWYKDNETRIRAWNTTHRPNGYQRRPFIDHPASLSQAAHSSGGPTRHKRNNLAGACLGRLYQ